MSHTPSPWSWQTYPADPLGTELIGIYGTGLGREGAHVADVYEPADARLIAASPRMYEYVAQRAAAGDTDAATILSEIHGATS